MNRTWNRALNKLREIVTSSHRLAPVMRFEAYAKQCDKDSYHLIESNRETVVMSTRYFGEDAIPMERFALPDAYWASLHHGKIIGGSSVVVTSDRKMLYDLLVSCDLYNANITDDGLFMLFGKPHHIGDRYFYSYLHKKGKSIEKGICLASNMSCNYYHFMFQVAAKLYYVDRVGFDKSIPLLIDEQALSIPQMKEVIEKLNKSERKIIPLQSRVLYEVGDLYCISDPNVVIPNRKTMSYDRSHAFAFDKKALDYLRRGIMDTTTKDNVPFAKRIFLSRKDCNRRNINENELKPILDKYGFEFVYSGEMDILSQARMFNQAEYIIGPSGAAFTNLLFCSKGCQVLLFVSHHHNTTCYSSLAAPLDVDTLFLAGNGNTTKLQSRFYKINPELLEQYLQNLFGQ
jgi:hypothetical protein